jgi:hypothetical protein
VLGALVLLLSAGCLWGLRGAAAGGRELGHCNARSNQPCHGESYDRRICVVMSILYRVKLLMGCEEGSWATAMPAATSLVMVSASAAHLAGVIVW